LPEITDKSELYTPATREKMKKLVKEIYEQSITSQPSNIKFDAKHNNRFLVDINNNSKPIRTSFTSEGTLLTLFEAAD